MTPLLQSLFTLFARAEQSIQTIIDEGVKIVFTSAGNPAKYTSLLKQHGITVVHVIANTKFAQKAEEAGVDALVAEGFEAGGHNGKEETTTLVLLPVIRKATQLPLIAAGGIGSGAAMLAAMALGADGVQIGSLFAVAKESSAHDAFKQTVFNAGEGDTQLVLKKVTPVRLLKNAFYAQVQQLEEAGASAEQLKELLGKGRARKGILEGDLVNGELEIGQVAAQIHELRSVADIMQRLITEFRFSQQQLNNISL